MSLFWIVIIITLGLLFLFVELFLIPGSALVGILGVVVAGVGVFLAYDGYGMATGNIVLLGTVVAVIAMVVTGLRRISRLKWADKETIDTRVNVLEDVPVQVGDTGTAFTTLRPNGMAIIGGHRLEVYSVGEYIDKDESIEVSSITSSHIYVKPINS